MRIQVLYFAVFRERLGRGDEPLEVADGATVADAIAALEARHPIVADAARPLPGRGQPGDGRRRARARRGDELVLIPPVAGGNDRVHVAILAGPLSLDRCVAAVVTPETGGVCTFTGLVRRHSRGVTVERLEYEAYAGMAEKVMRALVDELEAEVPGARIAIEHRVGALAIGDAAVVIAAAAPHRAEAFTACRAAIDRLKDRAPIWKKEFGDDGAVWVGLGP
jgi:molybdopterin synthase catalytic subunit/molybdopterin converting factor small subunit